MVEWRILGRPRTIRKFVFAVRRCWKKSSTTYTHYKRKFEERNSLEISRGNWLLPKIDFLQIVYRNFDLFRKDRMISVSFEIWSNPADLLRCLRAIFSSVSEVLWKGREEQNISWRWICSYWGYHKASVLEFYLTTYSKIYFKMFLFPQKRITYEVNCG